MFLLELVVPIAKDIEKASILKLKAIKKYIRIIISPIYFILKNY